MSEPIKKLYRSRTDRVIWGVCGGLSEYFNVDSTLIRIIFILLALGSGVGLMLYVVLALVVPNNPQDQVKGSEKVKELARELGNSAKKMSGEMKSSEEYPTRNILGLIILIVGITMLLKGVFYFHINWGIVFPFLIILFGFYLLNNYK
ncbi:MAG: PspC domain-containing protein [Patescibacteria group bacterium]